MYNWEHKCNESSEFLILRQASFRLVSWGQRMSCLSSDAEHLPQAGSGIVAGRKGVREGVCSEGEKVKAASLFVLVKS